MLLSWDCGVRLSKDIAVLTALDCDLFTIYNSHNNFRWCVDLCPAYM